MMKYADVGICNENASIRTIEVATHIIHNEDNNKLIRNINQLFHKKSKALNKALFLKTRYII